MSVDRIDMKEVMLHLPHDMAELGQVASKNAVAIHASQIAVDAFLAFEQLDEDRKSVV